VGEGRREEIQRVYLRLEEEFLDLAEYIPLVSDLADPRYAIASPRTAEFGLNCCTWVETLCRELLHDKRLDQFPEVAKVRKLSVPKMGEYRGILRERLGFAKGGYPLRITDGPDVKPFEAWEKDENPEWFKVYSEFKHDRFQLANRFTMGHALYAFVALAILKNHWRGFQPGGPYEPPEPASRVLRGI
jgi:hypothetical protein